MPRITAAMRSWSTGEGTALLLRGPPACLEEQGGALLSYQVPSSGAQCLFVYRCGPPCLFVQVRLGCYHPSPLASHAALPPAHPCTACTLTTNRWSCTTAAWTSGPVPSHCASGAPRGWRRAESGGVGYRHATAGCVAHEEGPSAFTVHSCEYHAPALSPRCCSWYGPGDPKLCFIERKTHRESWKGGWLSGSLKRRGLGGQGSSRLAPPKRT